MGPGKFIPIIDFNKATIRHMREYTPMVLKILGETLLTAVPVRLSGVHVINIAPIFEWIFNMLKTILPKKLADRVSTKLK